MRGGGYREEGCREGGWGGGVVRRGEGVIYDCCLTLRGGVMIVITSFFYDCCQKRVL